MENLKTSGISKEMISRLMMNRDGKLTSDQWKDIVMQPIIVLLILLAPGVFLFGPLITRLLVRGYWIAIIVALLFFVPLIFRARRYARAPVYYDTLYSGPSQVSNWLFWKPDILYTPSGERVRFSRRLAPFTILKPNTAHLVYYLNEPDGHVLLSLAPTEHPDSGRWQPSEEFYARQAQRIRH